MRIIICVVIMIIPAISMAQGWVGLGLGGHLNNVSFIDSNGTRASQIKGIPSSYASFYFGYDVSKPKRKGSRTMLLFEAGYKRGSSKNKESTTLETWTMDYLSSILTVRHFLFSEKMVGLYGGIGLSGDFLLGAVQQNGFEQYDLKQGLKNSNLGPSFEAGISYYISSEAQGTLGLSYMHGLSNMEKAQGQSAHVHGIKLGIGLFFKLNKH